MLLLKILKCYWVWLVFQENEYLKAHKVWMCYFRNHLYCTPYWKIMLKTCQSSKVSDLRIKDDRILDLAACASTIWYSLCIHNQIFVHSFCLFQWILILIQPQQTFLGMFHWYILSLLPFHSCRTKQLMYSKFQILLTSQILTYLCTAYFMARMVNKNFPYVWYHYSSSSSLVFQL